VSRLEVLLDVDSDAAFVKCAHEIHVREVEAIETQAKRVACFPAILQRAFAALTQNGLPFALQEAPDADSAFSCTMYQYLFTLEF
jgi:hypothetical protein